ncbi:MAG: DHH family phosphoesterase [Oscillospiraceae bacterium]
MNRKKLSRLLEPGMRLYFIVMVIFAVAAAVLRSYALAAVELAATVGLYLYFQRSNARRRKEILKYIDSVSYNVDAATKDTMLNAPLPMVIFRPDSDEVIWSNDRFLRLTGEREHLFDTKLSALVPGFSSRWLLEGKSECPEEVALGDRRYLVFGHLVHTNDQGGQGFLATTYWIDVTEFSNLRRAYADSRPVVALLLLDNYDEVLKNVAENTRSAILSEISQKLGELAEQTNGLFAQLDRDRYLLIFEAHHLPKLQEEKFPILDVVHNIHNPGGITATLSIGIGKDADNFQELFQYASLSAEMALSRGGDQAVIKNRFTFEFYGGRTKELEKRTKVKSRVMANALGELVADASKVFIMGHKYADLDCIGAAAGVFAVARKRGTPAYIIREPNPAPADDMRDRLAALPEYAGCFISPQDALLAADSSSLLVVVDTNRPEQVQSEELLISCNKVAVIDHHRRAATYIADAALNFHEPYASSASELVTELLQYILEPADLLRPEAEALLAGIVLDTKHFTMRTGGRTFEAAAFLRRAGADPSEVRLYFQNDLDGTIARYDIIQNAKLCRNNIAIAQVDHTVGRVTAAQAADELLNIAGIEASFVLFPLDDKVMISARSMGDTNVQVILEKLGGGGNAATAGAQVPGHNVAEVAQQLVSAINQYFEDD